MTTEPLYVAVISAFDSAAGAATTLYFASRGFTSKPTDTPANTPFDERLQQPADVERNLFAAVATRGRSIVALGDVVLNNPDGALDFMNELAVDGRDIYVGFSTVDHPSYPADFTPLFQGTMEQCEADVTTVSVKLHDSFYSVANAPLQTNKYLGTNALPDGLEGTAELTGKAKPVCFGIVKNVPAVPINTSKLIYQVNDGPVESIDAVYDAGIAIADKLYYVGGASGGSGGHLYTSPDGMIWTAQANPFSTSFSTPRAFAVGAGLVVAVGGDTGVASVIATSTDAVTWTARTSPFGAHQIRHVCWNGTIFVAADENGQVATSPNGITWTLRMSAVSGTPIVDLFWTGVVFVAVSAVVLATSTDGITWTNNAPSFLSSGSMSAGTWSDDVGLAVVVGGSGSDQGKIGTSPDGITWTQQTSPAPSAAWKRVVYGRGQFVLIDFNGTLAVSTDGVNWIAQSNTLGAININDLTFGRGIYTALTGLGIRSSSDGFNWDVTAAASVFANDNVFGGQYLDIPAAASQYASEADLLDDTQAPPPGRSKSYPAGGCFRLGSSPNGVITADVTQGVTSADRTAAALAANVLARAPGAPTFLSTDLTALDAANGSPLGYWTIDDNVTCDVVLDLIAGTVGASWYEDQLGRFRIAQFAAPSGSPVLTLTENEIVKGTLTRIASNDQGNGIPLYQVVVQWGQYYQTITTDLAGAVTDAARAEFAQQWRNAIATDLSVLATHPTAGVLTIQSLFANGSDGQTEADRQLALRKVKRDPFTFTTELNGNSAALDLTSVLEIVHSRYALSVVGSPSGDLEGGGLFVVLGVKPDAANKRLTFTVWGGARYKNDIDANGAYIIDANGDYVITEIAA